MKIGIRKVIAIIAGVIILVALVLLRDKLPFFVIPLLAAFLFCFVFLRLFIDILDRLDKRRGWLCPYCQGKGSIESKRCEACSGLGKITSWENAEETTKHFPDSIDSERNPTP